MACSVLGKSSLASRACGTTAAEARILLVFALVAVFFMSNETQHYRCSPETHVFGLLFPLLVLFRNERSPTFRWSLTVSAEAMLLFHLMHELDQ